MQKLKEIKMNILGYFNSMNNKELSERSENKQQKNQIIEKYSTEVNLLD